jgi:hypothetical protein
MVYLIYRLVTILRKVVKFVSFSKNEYNSFLLEELIFMQLMMLLLLV